jgi:hypothetical protein
VGGLIPAGSGVCLAAESRPRLAAWSNCAYLTQLLPMRKRFTNWRHTLWAAFALASLCLPGLTHAQFPKDGKRYAIFTTYLAGDEAGDEGIRDLTFALDNGCNAVEIAIRWYEIYPTATSMPRWSRIDRMVEFARSRGAKVALRISTSRKNNATFWSDDQLVRDAKGNPLVPYDDSEVRLGYTAGINKAMEFIRSVAQRYQYLNQQGQLMFISVTNNFQLELEYFGSNWRGDGGPPYQTIYDYNEFTIADFQQWSVRKYGSLAAVNQKWGTDFRNVSDIRPTYPNADGWQAFQSNRGLDWYMFRHSQLKNYIDRCIQTIKSVDPTINVINQHGSVIDGACDKRGTYAFKHLAELADGVKVNDSPFYNFQLSMDAVRSNIKPGGWIINELDGMFWNQGVQDLMKKQVEDSFKYGATAINFANYGSSYNGTQLKDILDFIKAKGFLNQPVSTVTPVGTVSYKLSRVIQSNIAEIGLVGQWLDIRGTDNKPVRIILEEDLIDGTSTPPENQPPSVSNAIPDQHTVQGQAYSYRIPDNTFQAGTGQITSITVSGLPAGLDYTASTKTISGTPSLIGSSVVTVTANDNKNLSVSDQFTLAVRQTASPLKLLDPLLTCSTGKLEFRSTDGDGTGIEYQLEGINDWTTQTSITLDEKYRNGSTLTVKARQSGKIVTLSYKTTCSSTNKPPVVDNPLPDRTVGINQFLTFSVPLNTFSDPDGNVASIAAWNLPPGLSFNDNTLTFTGAVTTSGSWTVTVQATDDKGATVVDLFVISTSGDIKPLKLLAPALNCNTGRFEFKTQDGDGTTIEYTMDRVFDWTTQSVHMLSDATLRSDMHYRARQSGVTYYGTYLPNCPPANKKPTVSAPIAEQNATQHRAASFTIPANTFADSDGKITSVTATGLPNGLTYNADTQTISGTPTEAGSWTVTVTATDDREGTVSTTFVFNVAKGAKLLQLLAPILSCSTGRLEFKTQDGDGSTIEYSIDGILGWTTQNNYTLAAALRFDTKLTIRAKQNGNETTVTYQTNCPRVNLPPTVANRIANQVLTVNVPASVAIPANTFADADGTIASVAMTGLPVGLTYDTQRRAVVGTPTLIGTSAVIVRATDNAGASVSDTFQITVRTAPRFTASVALLDGQVKTVRAISDGDLIDLQKIPELVNLSCTPRTSSSSVVMELSGKIKRTTYANAAPYQLYPTGQGFKPEIGSYQLKITAYSGVNGTGVILGTVTVRFDVVSTNEPGSAPVLNGEK